MSLRVNSRPNLPSPARASRPSEESVSKAPRSANELQAARASGSSEVSVAKAPRFADEFQAAGARRSSEVGVPKESRFTDEFQAARASPSSEVSVSKESRFSGDFQQWLQENGYGHHEFAKGNTPAFGGRSEAGEPVTKEPVIFIHGNSDSAAGWENSIEHFSKEGYKPSEMYAMTWGPSDPKQASQQHHSKQYLEEVRAFMEAVKGYTGAEKVDVIGHSMGVTLARKAIQGGEGFDPYEGTSYDLGGAMTDSVDTFVGIAGANHGLAAAAMTGDRYPTTNRVSGLHPQSELLKDLNAVDHDEGSHVYSIWSHADQVIGVGLAGFTSPIEGQDGQKVYGTYPYGHMGLKNYTEETQLAMIRDHEVR